VNRYTEREKTSITEYVGCGWRRRRTKKIPHEE
jgi:hypothetical protein